MSDSTSRQNAENEMIEAVAAALGDFRSTPAVDDTGGDSRDGEPSNVEASGPFSSRRDDAPVDFEALFAVEGNFEAPVETAAGERDFAAEGAMMLLAGHTAMTEADTDLREANAANGELEAESGPLLTEMGPTDDTDQAQSVAVSGPLSLAALHAERRSAALARQRARFASARRDAGARPDSGTGFDAAGTAQEQEPGDDTASTDATIYRLLGELDRLWHRAA